MLPGVGPKSAQRMAYAILERQREGGKHLAWALSEALDKVGHCQSCRTLSEEPICRICASPKRDKGLLCVVETPADVLSIEQAGIYQGTYFVLMGHLSPIDGIGPAELGLDVLKTKLQQSDVTELILATSQTVEGEATSHYIAQLARQLGVQVSRLAQGLPMGGELEYTDSATLAYAFKGRRQVEH